MIVQHVTPNTIEESQDQLLLAGSKITFSDIYKKQMDIPLVKGKFYRADDVDNTFILLNGVLTDVSQQAFSKQKQFATLQDEITSLRQQLAEQETASHNDDMVHALMGQVQDLQEKLEKRENDLRTLAVASKSKIAQLETQLSTANQENQELGDLIDKLVDKIQSAEAGN